MAREFFDLRNQLLNDAMLWLCISAIPSVGLSLMRVVELGWLPVMSVHLMSAVTLWLIWLVRKRLSYYFRVVSLLSIIWLGIYAGLLQFGPIAFSGLHTIFFSIIAILFLPRLIAWPLIVFNTLCLVLVGSLAGLGWLSFELDYQAYSRSPLTWVRTIWTFTAYAVILALITARMIEGVKKSEQFAQELAVYRQKIAEHVPGGIYQLLLRRDGSYSFPYVSAGFCSLFNIEEHALAKDGMVLFNIIHEDDKPMVAKTYLNTDNLAPLTRQSFRIYHKNQSILWLETSATPEQLTTGDVLWHGFVQDITELQLAKQQLTATLENTPNVAVQWYDRYGVVRYWNHASELLYGWTAEEAVGSRFSFLFHASESALQFPEQLKYIEETGQTIAAFECIKNDKQANKRVVTETIFAIPGRDEPIFVCVDVDISARKQAEESLKQSEDQFRRLFELSPIGIALNDFISGRFLEVNQALQEATGYSRDEILAMSYWRMTPAEYTEQELAQLQLLKDHAAYGPYEKEYIRKNGSRFPVLLNGFRLTDAGSRQVMWTLVQDISRHKEAEIALETARAEAESANRAKSEFLASMSHELRTPLNAIIGFGQLLELGELGGLNEQQQIAVGHIMGSGRHLLTLISEILDLVRIESGKMDLNLANVALQPLINEVVALSEPAAMVREITVVQSCPTELYALADASRVKQILLNLVSNAVKYNRTHGTVSVTAVLTDTFVRITVTDTGVGLTEQQQLSLFQPFQRLGAERSTGRWCINKLMVILSLSPFSSGRSCP